MRDQRNFNVAHIWNVGRHQSLTFQWKSSPFAQILEVVKHFESLRWIPLYHWTTLKTCQKLPIPRKPLWWTENHSDLLNRAAPAKISQYSKVDLTLRNSLYLFLSSASASSRERNVKLTNWVFGKICPSSSVLVGQQWRTNLRYHRSPNVSLTFTYNENCDVITEVQMFRRDLDRAEREGGKACRKLPPPSERFVSFKLFNLPGWILQMQIFSPLFISASLAFRNVDMLVRKNRKGWISGGKKVGRRAL